jgi:hypothetical protein
MLSQERLSQLEDLNHKDEFQRILCALWLYTHAPLYEYVEFTREQVNAIAAPVRTE